MFFGFESRPEFLHTDVKVKREIKRVCSRNKKMSRLSVCTVCD